jgi:hypothetical protein
MSKLLASGLLILVIATTSGVTTVNDKPSPFKITTKRDDDRVEAKVEKDKAIFSVHSPFGISHAVIERVDKKWPDSVLLRLHLKGLENFKATNGKVRLDAAMSMEEGKTKVRLWKDGKEDAPLDEKSPLWMRIRIVGGDGKPARELPLKDGYFEMTLSKAFFEGNPKSITLSWIDFYRN